MISVEQSVKLQLARQTEVLGENLPQCYFVYHKSQTVWPGIETGPPQWEAGNWLLEAWHGPLVRR
jgi:hypothetical protein